MVEQSKGSSKILFIKVPLPRFESKRHKGFQPRDIVETKNLYDKSSPKVKISKNKIAQKTKFQITKEPKRQNFKSQKSPKDKISNHKRTQSPQFQITKEPNLQSVAQKNI